MGCAPGLLSGQSEYHTTRMGHFTFYHACTLAKKGKRDMPKKTKTISVSKAKKKAWGAFSKWVRKSRADQYGMVKCCSCETTLPWELMQAGHFIPGRKNAVLYSPFGVHPQCYRCNIILNGNWPDYYAFMDKTYGGGMIDVLLKLSNEVVQMKAHDHMAVYEKYDKLLKES